MTINLTREDFEQAIKSGASVFEGNTILDTGKPSGRYYRFIRVPLANGEHKVDALYGQRFYGTLENKPVTFNQEIRFLREILGKVHLTNTNAVGQDTPPPFFAKIRKRTHCLNQTRRRTI